MPTRNLLPILPEAAIWSQLTSMRKQSRIAQSLLVIAPAAMHLQAFLDRLLTQLLCLDEHAPCGICAMCLKVLADIHPDIYSIKPEAINGTIKIEQIRDMQMLAYQTPQISERQIVVIYPAEAMNQAAASALLKVLEEPSSSTIFILITANSALLLPTLVSRCQQIHVRSNLPDDDLLRQGEIYAENSTRALLSGQRLQLLESLESLLSRRLSVCDLAQQWSEHPIEDGLWFFSCVLMKLLHLRLLPNVVLEQEYQDYTLFKQSWHPVNLYDQLDNIYAILKQLHTNVNLNTNLVWERIFLDFVEGHTVPC